MSNQIFFPDYGRSILNVSNSVLKHYGVRTEYSSLPILDNILQKKYKNVVLWILDGLGVDLLERMLTPNTFLRQHITDRISSVFPPTTTAATTTYYSGLPPVVHGWLGWSPYFRECDKCVELFTGRDTYTLEPTGFDIGKVLPYEHIFKRIEQVNRKVCCTEIFPKKIRTGGAETFQEECHRIRRQIRHPGEQFILAYWPDPDHTCHHEGTYVAVTRDVIRMMNEEIKRLCGRAKDTLFIISADHGHVPVKEIIYIDELPEITDCLRVPLTLDDRVSAIFLKPGKEQAFKEVCTKYLGKDFLLMKSKEALEKNLFGVGPMHPKIKDFVGDYLLIAVGEKVLRQRVGDTVSGPELVSSHAGLTAREMIVPLMIVGK